jgi:hypothetical protein
MTPFWHKAYGDALLMTVRQKGGGIGIYNGTVNKT